MHYKHQGVFLVSLLLPVTRNASWITPCMTIFKRSAR